jgi:hypothetical protein
MYPFNNIKAFCRTRWWSISMYFKIRSWNTRFEIMWIASCHLSLLSKYNLTSCKCVILRSTNRCFNQLISDFTTNGNHQPWIIFRSQVRLIRDRGIIFSHIGKAVAQNVLVTNCSIDLNYIIHNSQLTKKPLEKKFDILLSWYIYTWLRSII